MAALSVFGSPDLQCEGGLSRTLSSPGYRGAARITASTKAELPGTRLAAPSTNVSDAPFAGASRGGLVPLKTVRR